jgi:hypothetical protein
LIEVCNPAWINRQRWTSPGRIVSTGVDWPLIVVVSFGFGRGRPPSVE